MTNVPERYRPDDRLIDDAERLETLYVQNGLTIREIATTHADCSKTRVGKALDEHDIGSHGDSESDTTATATTTARDSDSKETTRSLCPAHDSATATTDGVEDQQSTRGRDPPTVDWSKL